MLIHQVVRRGAETLTDARVTAAFLTLDGRPTRQPKDWVAAVRSPFAKRDMMPTIHPTTDMMSPLTLFLQADFVVKLVMLGLLARQHLDLGDHLHPHAPAAPDQPPQRGL